MNALFKSFCVKRAVLPNLAYFSQYVWIIGHYVTGVSMVCHLHAPTLIEFDKIECNIILFDKFHRCHFWVHYLNCSVIIYCVAIALRTVNSNAVAWRKLGTVSISYSYLKIYMEINLVLEDWNRATLKHLTAPHWSTGTYDETVLLIIFHLHKDTE